MDNNNKLGLVIDINNGNVYANIESVAHITDQTVSDIQFYINRSIKKMELEEFDGVQVLNEDQIYDVIKYYRSGLVLEFGQHGLRQYLYSLVGYKHKQQSPLESAIGILFSQKN